MSSSNKRLRIAASALLVRERFLLAAAGRAGGRGEEAPTRIGGEVRSAEPGAMAQMGMGASAAAAAGDRIPARTERMESAGHSRQRRSSMPRVTSSAESTAAAAVAAPGGGAVALRGTVERRGRMSSSDLSASTIAGCGRGDATGASDDQKPNRLTRTATGWGLGKGERCTLGVRWSLANPCM